MIRINLLPFRLARKKENIRQQASIFLLSVVLILTLMFYGATRFSWKIADLNTRIEAAKAELVTYKEIVAKVEACEKALDHLRQKGAAIKELELGRTEPARMMDAMTVCVIPKMMWLKNMSAEKEFLNISGIAVDNATIAHFMKRLERSPYFTDVDLQSSQQTEVANALKVKSFSIRCKTVRPDIQPTSGGAT